MAPANLHLQRVFNEAFRQFDRERRSRFRPDLVDIEVKFYPYAGLHHTIRVRAGRVYVRLSDLFQAAPPEVMRALAFLLVARLLSRKAPAAQERIYRSYAFSPTVLRASELARRQRGRKVISSAQGKVYDLEQIFARVNQRYFDGQVATPALTWSKRQARSILAYAPEDIEYCTRITYSGGYTLAQHARDAMTDGTPLSRWLRTGTREETSFDAVVLQEQSQTGGLPEGGADRRCNCSTAAITA